MMILRTRWAAFAMLALFIVRSGEAQGATDNAGGCDDYDGIFGTSGDVSLCCHTEACQGICDQDYCQEEEEYCCPDTIADSASECGDEINAPCILFYSGEEGDETLAPTPAVSEQTEDYSEEDEEVGETLAPTPAETESIQAEPSQDDDDEDLSSTEALKPAGTPAPTPAVAGQTDDDSIEDVEDEDPNSTEDTPMGAIVGGAVAGTLVIVAVILAVLFKTGRLKASRGSSSKTAADDVTPAPPSGPVPADHARSQASESFISQHAGRPQYPVAHQYPQAL